MTVTFRRFALSLLAASVAACDTGATTATPCRADEASPTAVMSSTDGGATWTKRGRICMHDPSILSVDCTALSGDDGISLYFIDIKRLGQPAGVERVVYRAATKDGIDFDPPEVVLTSSVDMVDPAVVRTADGKIRLYVPSEEAPLNVGIISAVSTDGKSFTRDAGYRNTPGGMPGALVLPDGRVRIFVGGAPGTPPGISSMISDDGLTFAQESGLRIAADGPLPTQAPNDASPIRLRGGGYLMAFMVNPSDPYVALKGQYRLATSADGFTWTVQPTVFAEGGTSCLVEAPDGTLFFYYGEGV